MADAPDLGSGVLDVGVQVPLSAPVDMKKEMLQAFPFLFAQNVDISPPFSLQANYAVINFKFPIDTKFRICIIFLE